MAKDFNTALYPLQYRNASSLDDIKLTQNGYELGAVISRQELYYQKIINKIVAIFH